MNRSDYVTVVIAVLVIVVMALSLYNSVQLSRLEGELAGLRGGVSSVNSTLQYSIAYERNLTEVAASLGSALGQVNSSLSQEVNALKSQLAQLEARQGFPAEIVDALNRSVVIPLRPVRVVSLDPATTEILLAIGAGGQLVGVDNDSVSYLPPPFNYTIHMMVANGSVSVIGSTYTSPSIEEILSLRPDLVIGTAGWGYNNYVATTLAQYGIPVVLLPSTSSIEDIYRAVIMAGEATGHLSEAAQVVENMSAQLTRVETVVSGATEVNATVILWVNPTYVAGGGTFISDLITLARGLNAFGNLSGWPVISPEGLLQANPSVIIIVSNGGLFNVSSLYGWLNSTIGPAYTRISAINHGRVYVITGWYEDILSEPAVLVPLGLKLIAIILHPGSFNVTSLPQVISPSDLPLGPG